MVEFKEAPKNNPNKRPLNVILVQENGVWRGKILVDGLLLEENNPMYKRALGKSSFCYNPKYLAFMEVLSSFYPKNDEIPVHYEKVVLDFAEKNKDFLRKLDKQGDAEAFVVKLREKTLEMLFKDKELAIKSSLFLVNPMLREILLLAAYDLARLAGINMLVGKTDRNSLGIYYKDGKVMADEDEKRQGGFWVMAQTPQEACAFSQVILSEKNLFAGKVVGALSKNKIFGNALNEIIENLNIFHEGNESSGKISEPIELRNKYLMDALSNLEEALNLNPNLYGRVYFEMGKVYVELGNYKEAFDKYMACFNYVKDYESKGKVAENIKDSAIMSNDVNLMIKAFRTIEELNNQKSSESLKGMLTEIENKIKEVLES